MLKSGCLDDHSAAVWTISPAWRPWKGVDPLDPARYLISTLLPKSLPHFLPSILYAALKLKNLQYFIALRLNSIPFFVIFNLNTSSFFPYLCSYIPHIVS
jgi:hypothetical protein